MASLLSSPFTFFIFFLLLLNLASNNVSAGEQQQELIVEDGYTVTTLIDGHKLNVNPHAILPQPGSSDFLILDTSKSAFFTVSFSTPDAAGPTVKRFSGDGFAGYKDGEPGSARFNKPRSFAVDSKGNVYVADKANHAIRKISHLGVTTIAGGYPQKAGNKDGPGRNASFSDDFELIFVPESCRLLVSDHGNQLIRQIDLKLEDCATGSRSPLGAAVSIWVLGLGLSCIFGLVVGIAIRPYIITDEGSSILYYSATWKRCQINLGKLVRMSCFGIRSAVANSRLYVLLKRLVQLCLSHLALMFTIRTGVSQTLKKDCVSLLDSDVNSCQVEKSQMFADQLKDLINFNSVLHLPNTENDVFKQGEGDQESNDVLLCSRAKIDNMIQENIAGFAETTNETAPPDGNLVGSVNLVRRRCR